MTRLTLEWHLRTIRDGVAEGAYETGWPEDGRVCDAYTVQAHEALQSDDTVAYLDAVAHDPIRRHQERYDAARLLDYHIWPDSPDAGTLGRADGLLGHADRPDIDVSEWVDAGMVAQRIGPMYFAMSCVNPSCTEGECLADPDTLRDEGTPVCMVCGTEQPEPEYP